MGLSPGSGVGGREACGLAGYWQPVTRQQRLPGRRREVSTFKLTLKGAPAQIETPIPFGLPFVQAAGGAPSTLAAEAGPAPGYLRVTGGGAEGRGLPYQADEAARRRFGRGRRGNPRADHNQLFTWLAGIGGYIELHLASRHGTRASTFS